ncbi:MAG: hypothetical protein K2O18_02180 [Oscillospiraceae bacterium]|nr:hypothetical protein [Oscillospiraceae bacterium]
MFAPHTVTLYNARRSRRFDDLPAFSVTVLEGVFLDLGPGKNTLGRKSELKKSGLAAIEDAVLFIPFSCKAVNGVTGQTQTFVPPKTFESLENLDRVWTVGLRGSDAGTGCFFVTGRAVDPKLDFHSACRLFDGVFRVSSVLVRDFGSPRMRHWKVGGCAGP